MKNIFFTLIFLCFFYSFSQQKAVRKIEKSLVVYQNYFACKCEGITKNNQIVFGVSSTSEEANRIVADFNKRNWQTNYRIVHLEILKDSIQYIGNENYFSVFNQRCPKQYCMLTVQEQIATRIYIQKGLFEAIDYYRKSKNIPYVVAKEHLENLIYNLSQFRINFEINPSGQSN